MKVKERGRRGNGSQGEMQPHEDYYGRGRAAGPQHESGHQVERKSASHS